MTEEKKPATMTLDQAVTLTPTPTITEIHLSELHHTFGTERAEVDVQSAGAGARRLILALTPAQAAALDALHLAAVSALGVVPTKVPAPVAPK